MAGMGRKVKRWEAAILRDAVAPACRYLRRLHERMCAQAFDREDEVFRAVVAANDALHRLSLTLHYRSCHRIWSEGDPDLNGRPPTTMVP